MKTSATSVPYPIVKAMGLRESMKKQRTLVFIIYHPFIPLHFVVYTCSTQFLEGASPVINNELPHLLVSANVHAHDGVASKHNGVIQCSGMQKLVLWGQTFWGEERLVTIASIP